ncbi:MAG TPA: hypothetical protein DEF34_12430 [Desulfotomaculum sp.]|nr:MAG: hypothetical protein VR67_02940 [Peptococcaceae bacterium BRH_c8a]KJS70754.1 MAG: hypothetical protein JL56_16615 [Desulfotomaculum sp. BICA1-6]HBX24420.1 hypothetical protein [Desulfotomaculum sp.]
MNDIFKDFQVLMASEAFQILCNSEIIKLNQLLAIQALLIKASIPYDLFFSPGTEERQPQQQLNIYINPTTKIEIVIPLEPGGSIFGGT